MNSLAMEALLKVDEETPPGRSLKLAINGQHGDTILEDQVSFIEDAPAEQRQLESFAAGRLPEVEIKIPALRDKVDEEADSVKVVKSYRIGRWCTAQVLWDGVAGQYRYELLEPQLSAPESKKIRGHRRRPAQETPIGAGGDAKDRRT